MQSFASSSSSSSSSLTCFSGYENAHPPCFSTLPSSWKQQHQFPSLQVLFNYEGLPRVSYGRRNIVLVRANFRDSGEQRKSIENIAPFQPQSGTGQMLVNLLQTHPHLVSAAAEQQLNKLAEDRDATSQHEQFSTLGTDIMLYKRIAEMKLQERSKTLEEIMYALIVQKFVAANIPMVTQIQTSSSVADKINTWPLHEREFESVHSPDALAMVEEHIALILGGKDTTNFIEQDVVAELRKLHVGQVYAGSIMYGYFLRKMDERFQLEKSMKVLPPMDAIGSGHKGKQEGDADEHDDLAAEAAAAIAKISEREIIGEKYVEVGMKVSKLRSYILSLGAETLKTHATMRSRESMNVIEKQTEALFGRAETQTTPWDSSMTLAKDEVIKISYGGLKRLVLEAVTFGSFLWDVELQVDSHYSVV